MKKQQLTDKQKKCLDKINDYILYEKGIDISVENRLTHNIEYRSLFNTLCCKKYKIGHSLIARYYRSLGKKMTHASVIHSIDRFRIYSKSVPDILDTYFELHPSARNRKNSGIDLKYVYKRNLTEIQKAVTGVTALQEIELLNLINLRKKSWLWKSKDKITVLEAY